MALDAATLALTAAELKATLTDAKIAKLFEPTRDELVITLRTRTDTYALLLSARSGSARVCLTEETFENPETPPSFCMLMRKHLTGGKLLDVHMEPGDRIVYFDFQCTNEMGDLVRNTLCAELMGRYSNLVLVQNGKIIDALKRVDFEDSDIRQLLPGLTYTTPPKPARPDFLQVSSASIVAAACQRDLPVADALNKTVAGVGPVVCREAAWRAFDGEHLLANELTEEQKRSLMAAIDQLKELHDKGGCPCSVTDPDGKPVEFTFFRPQQYGENYAVKEWPSFNAMLEGYYAEKDRAERLRTKSKELHKALHNMYERAVRKQAARQEELAASGKSEKLRLYGELLSANLYLAQKGIDNMRRIFSSFFAWLEDEDYIAKSPVRRIHKVKTDSLVKEVLSDEQLEQLRDSCTTKRDLAIIDFLSSTGIRVGELVKLNREDIDFHERQCVVFGKGNKERVVYFNARTKLHLQQYLNGRTDDNPALFVSLHSPHTRLTISGVEVRIRKLGHTLSMPKVHPHKFRRTLATMAIDKGMPIEQVQRLLGHVRIDTTLHYAIVNQNNVKLAHKKYLG